MSTPNLTLTSARRAALDAGFAAAFGGAPERYFSAPGRTEIGGNHTDHQRGRVLAAAVTLDTQGGELENGNTLIVNYNDTYGELPVPKKQFNEFLGWYLNGEKVEFYTKIVTDGDHTLEARWLCYGGNDHYSVDVPGYDRENQLPPTYRYRVTDADGIYDHAGGYLDKAALKAAGYTKYEILLEVDMCKVDDGYIELWFCDSNKARLKEKSLVLDPGSIVPYYGRYGLYTLEWRFEISIDDLDDAGNFYVEFGASGSGADDWINCYGTYRIVAMK